MNQIDNIKSFTSDVRFDVVGLTCRMKSLLITAMFNIGTGGAIPVVAPTPVTHDPPPVPFGATTGIVPPVPILNMAVINQFVGEG